MASRGEARDKVGEESEALRAEIEKAMGKYAAKLKRRQQMARAESGDEVGEVSEALRAEIEEAMGKNAVFFYNRTDFDFSGSGVSFGDDGAVFLAEKVRGNTTVERLSLHRCGIGALGARALAEAVGEDSTTLKELDLLGNISGDDGAEAMAPMLRKNTTLEEFDLGHCGVGGRGVRALGEALKENCTLKGLRLNHNDIGGDGAQALADALRWNESLEKLSLQHCQLTDAGASSLLASLRESNSTLTHLNISFNFGIADDGIMDAINYLLEENRAVRPVMAERRARCLLFCCLQLAPTAHEHAVPSIGAVPVPVMQYAVEHAANLHVAERFEQGKALAGQSSTGVRPRFSSADRSGRSDLESATPGFDVSAFRKDQQQQIQQRQQSPFQPPAASEPSSHCFCHDMNNGRLCRLCRVAGKRLRDLGAPRRRR